MPLRYRLVLALALLVALPLRGGAQDMSNVDTALSKQDATAMFAMDQASWNMNVVQAAAIGMAFSTRQVLLHIMPGDAGYGTALLGYHYYTLALIGFAAAIVLLAAMLLFDRLFAEAGFPARPRLRLVRRGGRRHRRAREPLPQA